MEPQLYSLNIFAKLPKIHLDDNILLISHNDLDGSGPAILLHCLCDNITTIHVGNAAMSKTICDYVTDSCKANEYDIIIACDISVTEEDAEQIDASENKNKFLLLDHHSSASYLKDKSWAVISPDIIADSYRMDYYPPEVKTTESPSKMHSSGTSLLYDYLDYYGYTQYFTNRKLVQDFVHKVAVFDTGDSIHIFGRDEIYSIAPTLFDIYGSDFYESTMIERLSTTSDNLRKRLEDMDAKILIAEDMKITRHLDMIKHILHTGTLKLKDRTYSVMFCFTDSYLTQTFTYMMTEHPSYDIYFIDYGNGISLRTAKPDINVGEIAKQLHGGGHPGAAGFRHDFNDRLKLIMKTFKGNITLDDK